MCSFQNKFFSAVITLIVLLTVWCSTLSAAVVAVNAGGPSYTAADGTTYAADIYFNGGSTYSVANAISSTSDDTLYQSLRYGYGTEFSYNIPISDGTYDVTLKFAELYYDNVDDQVFSVSMERTEVISSLDILDHASKFEAYDVTIESVVIDGGELNITFVGANDAAVCAIEVNIAASQVNISADPFQIDAGGSTTLTWSATNADTVSIDNGIGVVGLSGSVSVSPTVTTTYTITADGPGGTAQDSTTVVLNSPVPTVSISASPVYIAEGGTTTLTWTSTDANSASIDNDVGTADASGSIVVSPSGTGVITYIITVTGPGGTAQDSVDITVNPLPTVIITSDITNITIGESATLTWSSSDADTVDVQPISSSALSGSQAVTPVVTTTYTITGTNTYGSREDSVTVMVDQSPIVSISASPAEIVSGSSSTLTWTSEGADTVSIDQEIGEVSLKGSLSVTPLADTQYTITAENEYGTATGSVTVSVSEPSTASITASPNPINAGDTTTLTWSSTNADSATIDPGIGSVEISGSTSVSPVETTTYTLTVDGPGGVATHSVTVTVNEMPTVSLSADPAYIGVGDSATLTWISVNATSASIDQSVGVVDVNGSTTVSPTVTTTYTITVEGSGGTATASTEVSVYQIPTVSITADADTIDIGDSATLTWTSTDAATATINAIGHVDLNGSVEIWPLVTTTYAITVEGPGGSASDSITVSIASQMSVAVNCGGEAYTAIDGTNYVADTYYTGGNVYSTSNAIASTSDDELYRNLRYGYGSDFSYAIPLADWSYDITLRFAEIYYDAAGDQVFSVTAEGTEIITDLDILSQVGTYEAHDVTITSVNVSDGVLNITFSGVNDAAVCAIEVAPTPPTASISADPNPVVEGQTAILYWNSTDGTAASIDAGIGEITPNVYSSTGVSPVTATTYTITVDGPGGTITESVVLDVNNLPVVDISSGSGAITEGESATLTWTTSYADIISIDQEIGDVTGSSSCDVSPVATTTYTITATNDYGSRTDSVTVIVNSLPVITSFEASANPITQGASTTLTWTVTGATSISIDQGIGDVTGVTSYSVAPATDTTYTITATNAYGTRTATFTVTVDDLPTVSISAAPAEITEGGSSELGWISDYADSLSIDQGIGDVTGTTAYMVSPAITTTYTITATNTHGDRTDSVTVTVNTLPVIDSFTADSGTITEETSATLSWTVTDANTVSLNQGIGTVSVSGSQAVTPSVTTTYTLTAVNSYGSRSSNVTIIVNELPTASISATPASLSEGESTTLSWNTTNSDSASIDQEIGTVSVNGSTSVAPAVTTTYTITATNSYGSRTDTVTVTVNTPPTIESYTSALSTITEGGSTILSWSSTGGTFASIDQGVGSVAVNGSATVSPAVTTTYTLTVSNTYGSDTAGVTVSVDGLPQVSIAALPDAVTEGESSTLSWSSFNADSVSIDGGIGTVTANTPGTQAVSPAVTTTYTITAVNTIGSRSATVTVTVNMLPSVSINADTTTICGGSTATLSWSSTDADALSINQGIGDVTGTNSYTVSPSATTTYTITATNAYGRASQTIAITVDPLPSVTISASANPINEGDSATLSWSSSDATSVSIDQGIGTVSESGTTDVSPSSTTTYTITSTNDCGDVTDSITITVYNVPIVSISAASPTIDEGESTTLTWTSASATSASIDQGIGSVDVNGSTSVSPTLTTTYTITVTGPAGTNTDSATVTVNPLPVIESFAASPTNIASGDSATLSWTTSDTTSLSLDQGIGNVTGTTSYTVAPSATTTYTLTATNSVGSRQLSVTVMVGEAPAIDSFSAAPTAIISGNSSTLSWRVSGADSVSIDQGVGTVAASGTTNVSPSVTTTYTLSATNTYGSATAQSVTITVGTLPTVSISASPDTIIEEDESSTLTWSSTDATVVEIDQGIGTVVTSGSHSVSPAVTTTYTITASNTYGSVTDSATVTVNNKPYIDSFTASPAAITEGGSATLSWTTTGAGMAAIDQEVGTVGLNSSATVSPLDTTVYTLTTTNTYGSRTATVTVTVHNLPTVSISSDTTTITDGESVTLTWSSTDAAGISIDHGIGAVAASGSTAVSPVVTTMYRITATNAYGSDSQDVTITVNNLPVVSITATPETITEGESATLVWSAANADSATIDQEIGTVELGDSLAVTPAVTTTYTLTATNTNGSRTATVTVTVGLVPTVTISASPDAVIQGETTTLTWSSTDATTVNIDHGVGTVTATGTVDVAPVVTTTYTIVAANEYGTASSSATVTVNGLPTLSITASPDTITQGESATLSWSSSNAVDVSIDQGIGTVTENIAGSQTVSPAVTTVYTITATNTNGTVTANVTVTVNSLPVISSFTSDVSTITEGGSVTLSWETTGADSASIDQGIGAVDPIGTISASPVITTTYILTVANAYGSGTASVTVTVNNLPTVSLSADLSTITEGETATLSWISTNANALSIDQGIGDVTGTTSFSVSPVLTTTYTITATNDYGTATDSVTITVNNLPAVSLAVDPAEIIIGATSNLSWSSSNAESVYLNQGLGSQLANAADSTGVSPTVDTTYVIIATNAYGTRTASADITVLEVPLPEVSISATPNPIASGEESILSWMSSNANTLGIEPDLGLGTLEPDVASTTGVSPTENTTYTITATNEYGSVSESVTIVVGQPPTVSISATKETITDDETTTLVWESSGADSCEIDQEIGTVELGGATDISPDVTTTYTITATNVNGETTDTVTVTVNPLPTIDTFETSASSINNGGTASLSWTTTDADSASIDHGVGVVEAASGTADVSPLVSTTYTIAAWNDYGMVSSSLTITVTQLPIVGISASPEEITAGDTSTLSWTASNADTVSIDQEIGDVDQSGSLSVAPAVTTEYTITATKGDYNVTDSVTITVGNPPVIDTFTAVPATITQGESAGLSWSVTGADTVSIDQGIGDVTGSTSYSVSPSATTTYTLTAANAYGSVIGSVTVTVGQLPSVDISASPETITEGETATLTWTSVNAESCSIDQEIGTVAVSGSADVSPSITTTYTITATNTSGEATDSVTVTVYNLPVISITAAPAEIVAGSSSTLTWTSTNADSVSLSHGIGAVDLNGSTNVSPSFTTTYTIIATNTYGSVSSTVTVMVYDVPGVSIDAEPANIITGGLTTLTWTSTDATSASIDQSIGSVDLSGSVSVSPTVTTTYTITVEGVGGTATDSITVGVNDSIAVNITASPETIVSGEQSVLFWDSTGANSLSIDGSAVDLEGWKNVTPAVTTTYTISANGGVVTDTATIIVAQVPTVSISASSSSINEGEAAVITWESTDADSASMDNAVGAVEVNGSMTVSPAATTTYTITVNGAGGTASSSVTVSVNALPTVSISADPQAIAAGSSTTLAWTSANADTVSIDQSVGSVDASGSQSVTPASIITYTITAENAYGTATDSVTVTVYQNPTVEFYASSNEITEGASATLTWTSTDAESASINQGIGSVDVNGSISVSPVVTTTYTITVTGQGGTATDSETITVNQLPNVSISASPNNIASGGSTTLSWSSSNADSAGIDQSIGAVALSGSTAVSPSVTTTYTITATNTYGDTTDSVTIMVEEPPIVSISASPAEIAAGSQATLSWTSSGADMVSISQGIGAVNLEGESVVTPAVTTTYTITATNTFGTDTGSVTITVHPVPTVNITATPTVINLGQSSTLTWTSSNATSASIDIGIGSVAVNGSMSVAPIVTTTYTITVTGSGGSTTDRITVNVNQAPTVSITSDPTEMALGEAATLTWASTNAISASIDQGIGTVSVNGSTTVTPAVTTTYTITVEGPGGTATNGITVTISDVVSVSISASVSSISLSESTTLTWTSANADSASIDQGIGAVEVNGTITVTPASTKTYTITVEGQAGTATASVEVVVYQPPEVTITAEPDRVISGEASTLTWTSTNATSVSIDQEIGAVDVSGTMEVFPELTTIYTITAAGDWDLGVATDSVTVGVCPREAAFIPTRTVVPSGYSYGIAVVDLEARTVAYTLDDVGNMPMGIVPDSSLDYIYVSCLADQTVEKIDVFTGEKLAAINVTDLPRDIAITPDGSTVYVSLHNNEYNGGQNIPVIDTATDTLIDTMSTPNDAKAIDMSPDGNWLYASSVWGHSSEDQTFYVSVFDTTTNNDEAVIDVDPYHPFDLVASPDGSRVYIANMEEGLSYIDTSDNSFVGPVIAEADKQYIRLEVSPDGAYIYAVTQEIREWDNLKPGISVIDADTLSLVGTLDIAQSYLSFSGINIHPTRDELYVVFSDTAGTGLPDFYVIDISDPAAMTISNSLTIGRHDDIYGEFLIVRP